VQDFVPFSMSPIPDRDDPTERQIAALVEFMDRVPMFQAVASDNPDERRLWRACELCTFLEYRLAGAPAPRAVSDADIHDWARRGLAAGETLGDPDRLSDFRPYWLAIAGRRLGQVAVTVRGGAWGRDCLWIASLYLFPEERGAGYGTLAMGILEGMARHLGLAGVRLETDWLWQGAVRFYLRRGFWVQNWKRGLSLVRWFADPPYRIRHASRRMEFAIGVGVAGAPAISAQRRGETLIWEECVAGGRDDDPGPLAAAAPTFALWLAVRGWPLIRGPQEWEDRHRWSDTGMPEGLACKIAIFEGYARHCGFRVDTPRIPGLVYPAWGAF
jgi:GNAT superfamily N-acetyltransferase